MRKLLLGIILISLFTCPAFSKTEKLDVKSNSFMDLGRFVETLEINDEEPTAADEIKNQDILFEEQAIKDIAKRYEEQAVELKLDDIADDSLNDVNGSVFKLKVNETQYKIEQSIKNENMIWDSSKAFSRTFLTDTRHMAPIPSVINSSKVTSNVSNSLSADLGQAWLYDSTGPSVLFVRANESTYNTGSVISYKGDSLKLSVGSFSSSYNHEASGGAILSSNSINLPRNAGSFVLGGAYFANEGQEKNKSTSGGFVEYTYKRLKLNAQLGQSKYTYSSDYDTSLYFAPELQISDSLYLKTRFIRNVSQDTMQDELVLTYKPKKSLSNFEFEVNASNQYSDTSTIKQRIKFSTSFRI